MKWISDLFTIDLDVSADVSTAPDTFGGWEILEVDNMCIRLKKHKSKCDKWLLLDNFRNSIGQTPGQYLLECEADIVTDMVVKEMKMRGKE